MYFWWISQFAVSFFIYCFAAMPLARFLLNANAASAEIKSDLEFILSFTLVTFLASFFVVFHKLGLLLLFLSLVLFWIKSRPRFLKFHWSDFLVVIPVLIVCGLNPITIDSNIREYQMCLFHSVWPLDFRNRLDSHFGMAGLFHYWFFQVPLVNSLSVQVPFFALFIYRILKLSLILLLRRSLTKLEHFYFLTLYAGSLFYRKQIFGKASPLGGALVFLIFASLSVGVGEGLIGEVLLGWLMACTMIFGEYGFLVLVPVLGILAFSKNIQRGFAFNSFCWAMLFLIPEVTRKLFESRGQFDSKFFIYSGGFAILAFLLKRYRKSARHIFRNLKGTRYPGVVFATSVVFAIYASLFIPSKYPNEGAQFNFYQWTIGREGILFLLALFVILKPLIAKKNHNETMPQGFYPVFQVFIAMQFLFFFFQRFASRFDWFESLSPDFIWMNLHKNADMISFPLFTVLIGTLAVIEMNFLKHKKGIVLVSLFFSYFIFLQDPLVKRVGDGPLSPYAPRLSAFDSLREMVWPIRYTRDVISLSHNIILWAPLAIHEPDLIERVRELQQKSRNQLLICLDQKFLKPLEADWDLGAYSIEFPTGALSRVVDLSKTGVARKNLLDGCDYTLLTKTRKCLKSQTLTAASDFSILCQ